MTWSRPADSFRELHLPGLGIGTFNERYVVDEGGKRLAVVLEIDQFKKILEELEELESIRAYDAAKAHRGEPIPIDGALSEIEDDRR